MKNLFMLLLMLPMMVISQESESELMTMTEFIVKQGHSVQFKDGVKKWKTCYNENQGSDSWSFWSRVHGERNVYGVTGYMPNWAEMDKDDEAGNSCRVVAMNFIMPHVEKAKFKITKTLPAWSRKSSTEETKLVWVSYFRVKDRLAFSQIVKDVTTVMTDKEGEPRGYWFEFMGGGEMEPDYMVSSTYSSYADIDLEEKKDGPFSMYKKAKGDKKAKEMNDQWKMAVDAGWSYIWEYDKELSN